VEQSCVTRPENVVRVPWESNQLVLFDNRSTQHYAIDNHDGRAPAQRPFRARSRK
jgi:alkyl sulfatase